MTDLVFQAGEAAPRRLVILLHGVGSSARDMAPLGQALAEGMPDARVIVAEGFDPFDLGGAGRQWFSVRGVTPENRAARVEVALPRLLDRIEAFRLDAGLDPASVSLFGFSQGAIMSLAAAAGGYAVGSIVSAAGRLAAAVERATPESPRLLFLHGDADTVIPVHEGRDAARALTAAGYSVSFIAQPGHGHGVSAPQLQAALDWFRTPQG
jgi:phospholipase/carboxylesterase